jgi:hypothetical protein
MLDYAIRRISLYILTLIAVVLFFELSLMILEYTRPLGTVEVIVSYEVQ